MKKNHDIIEVQVTLKHETEKAYLVDVGDGGVWVPKSLCEFEPGAGVRDGLLQISEDFAIEKGLL